MASDKLEALHRHVKAGNYIEVLSLVDEGVDPDGKDSFGRTPLMWAALRSHKEVFEVLLDSGGVDVHCCDNSRSTVLHHAADGGSVEIVHCLVNKGVNLDWKDSKGKTPLMIAARVLHSGVFELLVNSGADIYCCDNSGCSVMHHAARGGSLEIVQSLVNKGVPIDQRNQLRETPLMLAAEESHKEIVELLIDAGADIHCCDANGWTMLHHTSIGESMEIAECFVNKGVELDKKNHKGETALMWAAQESHEDIVEVFIKAGADIHYCDGNGWTVLHHAALGENVEITRSLVDKGVALDLQNEMGSTPLHLVACWNDTETTRYLLKAGSDCNIEDNTGESPFNYLIRQRRPDIETIQLCIEKGAYVKLTDYKKLLKDPLLKEAILQDVKLCSKVVINKFNNRDLPLLYKELGDTSARKLPPIGIMKIGDKSEMALEVERAVTHEIQANGYCNVFQMVPLVLGMLCIKSIEKSRLAFNQANPSTSQQGSKRVGDEQDNLCKKFCN